MVVTIDAEQHGFSYADSVVPVAGLADSVRDVQSDGAVVPRAAVTGSALVLGAVIQPPGVSGFFGCTPLGPVGWSIALGTTTSATLLGALASHVVPQIR